MDFAAANVTPQRNQMGSLWRSRSVALIGRQFIRFVPLLVTVVAAYSVLLAAAAVPSWDGTAVQTPSVVHGSKKSFLGKNDIGESSSRGNMLLDSTILTNAEEITILSKTANLQKWDSILKPIAIEVSVSLICNFIGLPLLSKLGSSAKILQVRWLRSARLPRHFAVKQMMIPVRWLRSNLHLNRFLSKKQVSCILSGIKRVHKVVARFTTKRAKTIEKYVYRHKLVKRTKATAKYLFRNRGRFSGLTQFGDLLDVGDKNDDQEVEGRTYG